MSSFTVTPNLGLKVPIAPTAAWDNPMNFNLATLDAAIGSATKGPYYDLRDYNGMADGSDATAAFQAAIDAATANTTYITNSEGQIVGTGGGTVYVPPGTWMVSQLVVSNYTHIVGAGYGTSVLKLLP